MLGAFPASVRTFRNFFPARRTRWSFWPWLWMQLGGWNTATGSSGSKAILNTVTGPGMKSTEVSLVGTLLPTTTSSPTRSWSADTWCDWSNLGNRFNSISFQGSLNWSSDKIMTSFYEKCFKMWEMVQMRCEMTISQDDPVIRRHSELGLLSLEQDRGPRRVLLRRGCDLEDGGIVGCKDLGAFGPQQKGLRRDKLNWMQP